MVVLWPKPLKGYYSHLYLTKTIIFGQWLLSTLNFQSRYFFSNVGVKSCVFQNFVSTVIAFQLLAKLICFTWSQTFEFSIYYDYQGFWLSLTNHSRIIGIIIPYIIRFLSYLNFPPRIISLFLLSGVNYFLSIFNLLRLRFLNITSLPLQGSMIDFLESKFHLSGIVSFFSNLFHREHGNPESILLN